MSAYLLDVNVLLALSDPLHVHNARVNRWLSGLRSESWATCPLTENGYVRIASNPRYSNRLGGVDVALRYLSELQAFPGWHFWTDEVGILDILEPGTAITHSQITDLYLLGLASHNGGKLATLDSRINATAVRGGREALFVIPV